MPNLLHLVNKDYAQHCRHSLCPHLTLSRPSPLPSQHCQNHHDYDSQNRFTETSWINFSLSHLAYQSIIKQHLKLRQEYTAYSIITFLNL